MYFLLLLEKTVQIQKQGNYLSFMSEISHHYFYPFYALSHSSGLSLNYSSLYGMLAALLPALSDLV